MKLISIVLLIAGVAMIVYFGFLFDTDAFTQTDVGLNKVQFTVKENDARLLNTRLIGMIGGIVAVLGGTVAAVAEIALKRRTMGKTHEPRSNHRE